MSNSLRNLCAEDEVLGRESVPAKHRARMGERIERRIDLSSRKYLRVVFRLALSGSGVEYSHPLRARPPRSAYEKPPRLSPTSYLNLRLQTVSSRFGSPSYV